jgi:hypothetical protein
MNKINKIKEGLGNPTTSNPEVAVKPVSKVKAVPGMITFF